MKRTRSIYTNRDIDLPSKAHLMRQPRKEVIRNEDFVRQNPMLVIDVDKSEFYGERKDCMEYRVVSEKV